ncbi:MAG TPA: DNA repair exonuclease [Polyangiales bacterium]|nr:DNA repair exonuclease [Polyangiales bacterium]
MRFSIVHAADLHLDSPLVGLERYEGAPVAELRSATRRALANLVQLCLDEDAKLLLLAGDLYDGDWKDYSTGLYFASQLARLREVGTRVVWIRGNHDAQSKITKHLALGEHCTELATKKPETVLLDPLDVAVHGQGFATAAVSEDLSERYPPPIAGALNFGLLHTALGGRRGHASYAPCDASALALRGYDYWALGHVHQSEVVQAEPYIVFPGNLQARHVRETGAKGAMLITVEDGAIQSVRPRALDVVRFAQVEVDVSEARGLGEAAELTEQRLIAERAQSDGRLLCARVHLSGRSRAHAELAREAERTESELRARAHEHDVWVEGVKVATDHPYDVKALAAREDATGQLVRTLRMLDEKPSARGELMDELRKLERSLPHEVSLSALGIDLSDERSTQALIQDVGRMLLPRVAGGEP